MSRPDTIGAEALRVKGRWRSHRWLWLRRASQLSVFALFLLGPLADVWIVKGNLASSLTLDTLPLTDPYVLLQSLAAGHWPASAALIGLGFLLGAPIHSFFLGSDSRERRTVDNDHRFGFGGNPTVL